MATRHLLHNVPVSDERSLKTLVENRTVFTLNDCELNVFETFRPSQLVPLTFSDFVVTSMVRGKKIMHLAGKPGFDYLPGETVLVPAHVTMEIDFPEASGEDPTQCIALALDSTKIRQTICFLNEKYPRTGTNHDWQLQQDDCHIRNDGELASNLNKLIAICSTDAEGKEMLADLALQELVTRIAQRQNLQQAQQATTGHLQESSLSFIVAYIKAHISERMQVDKLSAIACMSKATFYRAFKREFGINPYEFILEVRLKKAKKMLSDPATTITEVCYDLGFTDLSYFDRQFKKAEGITPRQYKHLNRPVS